MPNTVLILGATGRFGRNTADAFAQAGWSVRRFDRKTDDLANAANGADVIVAGWNPQYHHWATQVPGLHAQIRKAALDNDATVILPGNVYVFGPQAPSPWSENTPHLAENPLALIRRDMEESYRREGVKTILLRAGDYLDTKASGNWFDQIIAKPLKKGRISFPGAPDAPHAWAYLPDLARAVVLLAEKRQALARFEDIPFPGYTLSGNQMAKAIAESIGRPVRLRKMSWLPLHLARPFMPMAKHLFEMRYLWSLPHALSGEKFEQQLPDFKATPIQEALDVATRPLR
jgi:nucleoside-diphosphate-sugar epimerase